MANMNSREVYISSLQRDESLQALDVGTGWDFGTPCRNKKALVVVKALQGRAIGYRLDYKNLACKRFQKWASGAAWFKPGDMLSPGDVKAAVREFYRLVATGELGWADGVLRQLQLTRLIDGTTYLEVVPFVPGLYRDKSKDVPVQADAGIGGEAQSLPSSSEVTASSEVDVVASLEAILRGNISDIEREVVGKAMASLLLAAEKTA